MKNIIHIHVPKTGGSWLNEALKEYAGEYLQYPRHVQICEEVQEQWRTRIACPTARHLYNELEYKVVIEEPQPSWHMPGKDVWETSTKVAVCRNPFDLLVSMYHYKAPGFEKLQRYVPSSAPSLLRPVGLLGMNAIHGISSFEDFIKKWCDEMFPFTNTSPNQSTTESISLAEANRFLYYQLFHANGECGVDVILRNESLAEGTSRFLLDYGYVDTDVTTQLQNRGRHDDGRSARKDRDYRTYYTDELRELVEVCHLAELKLFEYDFDGPTTDNLFIDPKSVVYVPRSGVAFKGLPIKTARQLAGVGTMTNPKTEQQRQLLKESQRIANDVYWVEGTELKGRCVK